MSESTPNISSIPSAPIISSMQLRRQSGTVLNRIEYRGEQFIIARAGKPMALLVPLPLPLARSQPQAARHAFMKMTEEMRAAFADVPEEEAAHLIQDVVAWARQAPKQ